jgi:hypothetical protein
MDVGGQRGSLPPGGGCRRSHGGQMSSSGFAVGAGGGGDHRGRVGVEHAHQRQFTHTFRTLSDTAKPQCLCGLFAVHFTEVWVSMQPIAAVVVMIVAVLVVFNQDAIRPRRDRSAFTIVLRQQFL